MVVSKFPCVLKNIKANMMPNTDDVEKIITDFTVPTSIQLDRLHSSFLNKPLWVTRYNESSLSVGNTPMPCGYTKYLAVDKVCIDTSENI